MIERVIKYAIPLLVFLLPACSQEEEPGAALHPMEFSVSISDPPLSRVSETADGMGSTWSKDDKILVNVTQGETSSTTKCTLKEDGTVAGYSPILYWDGNSATISAYYSNIQNCKPTTDKTVDLADQRTGLAYVLYAQSTTVQRKSNIELKFNHRLAKVRIKVEGEKAQDVTAASINNYTSCTVDDNVNFTKRTSGYIQMRENGEYFEANVLPTDEIPDNFISFGDDFEVSVSGITSLEAGKVYTITIDATSGASSSVETTIGGHPAVLMRDGDNPLYVATMNIGADKPEDIGAYFWWGDVVGYIPDQYINGDVTFTPMDGGDSSFSFSSSNSDILTYKKSIDDLIKDSWVEKESPYNLLPTKDAASVKWGGNWRMPTDDDRFWLFNNSESNTIYWSTETNSGYQYFEGANTILVRVTESAYTPITWSYFTSDDLSGDATTELYANGTNAILGVYVKSKSTGGVVFLPQGGHASSSSLKQMDKYLTYWTSTPQNNTEDACYIFCQKDRLSPKSSTGRYMGLPIRPVMNK